MKTRADDPKSALRGRAIKLLAQREYSRAELAKKLAALGSTEDIDSVLDQLEHNGLLSDARAAAAYVRSHAARFGAARLRRGLHTKGIGDALIATCLAEVGMDGERERAGAIWRRKFGIKPNDAREWARQARFLQGRGFSTDIICKLLKTPENEHE